MIMLWERRMLAYIAIFLSEVEPLRAESWKTWYARAKKIEQSQNCVLQFKL